MRPKDIDLGNSSTINLASDKDFFIALWIVSLGFLEVPKTMFQENRPIRPNAKVAKWRRDRPIMVSEYPTL